ncbi:MAG: very short patch repair endonuclease [Thermoleophilia bacterium]
MDIISKERRSWNMAQIKSADTMPEKKVRSTLHRMGYRFALHCKDLPGRPDIVLSKYRTAIFVNGCFWHRHPGCKYAYMPKTRIRFWQKKFDDNISRDKRNRKELEKDGWTVIVVWECEVDDNALGQSLDKQLKHIGVN